MSKIKPFQGLRPKPEYARAVAALPYDVYNRKEAKEVVKNNPYSFLRVDRAETTLDDTVGEYDDIVYKKARENMKAFIDQGIFIEEDAPVYYLYELTREGRTQTGLVAACSVDEYLDGETKKHELTRREKEEDRVRHIDTLDMDTGPIYLTYRGNEGIKSLIEREKKKAPLFDFTSDNGIKHRVFKIDSPEAIDAFTNAFRDVDALYIADGHHRCASTVRVAEKRRSRDKTSGEKPYDYFLSVIFPDDELQILDYNRVVKDLNGYSTEEFLEKVKKNFSVTPSETPVVPEKQGVFGMYLDGKWYRLEYKEKRDSDPVKSLDVSILSDALLSPILGIEDLQTDERIDFVEGIRGLEELERRAETDMKVAFSLYPTSIDELICIADQGRLMPPKSTWFEPKLRSGLFIYKLF